MKKTLSLLLCILMVASISTGLAQSVYAHEESGISFTVPEGYMAEDASEDDIVRLAIYDPNDATHVFAYEVYYVEDLADMWLEDLSEDQLQYLAESLAGTVGDLSYTLAEEEGVHYMLVASEDETFCAVISLLNGWACTLYAVSDADGGYVLTEDVWDILSALQLGIDYGE